MHNNDSNQSSFPVYLRDTFNYFVIRTANLLNWLQPLFYISRPLLINLPQGAAPSTLSLSTRGIFEQLESEKAKPELASENAEKSTHRPENKKIDDSEVKSPKMAIAIKQSHQSLKNAFINAAHGNIQITQPITFTVKKAIDQLAEESYINNGQLINALEKLINTKIINTHELPTATQFFSAAATSFDAPIKTSSELVIEMIVLSMDYSELVNLLLKINQRSPLAIEKIQDIKTFLDNRLLSISEFDHILDTIYASFKNEKQTAATITTLCKLTKTEDLTTFINDLGIGQDTKNELKEYLDESHGHAFRILHG